MNKSINNINNNNNNSFNSNNNSLRNYGNNALIFLRKKMLSLKIIKQQLWDLAVLILWLSKKRNLERHLRGCLWLF